MVYIHIYTYMYVHVYMCICVYHLQRIWGGWGGGRVRLWTPTVFFKLVKFTYVHSKNTENRPHRTLSSPLIRAKNFWIQNNNLDQGQPVEMSPHLT